MKTAHLCIKVFQSQLQETFLNFISKNLFLFLNFFKFVVLCFGCWLDLISFHPLPFLKTCSKRGFDFRECTALHRILKQGVLSEREG
jgi:hypothetical protein